MKIPGIIIGGTNSGCGKTTVTIGLLAALIKKGINVQPYKVGPDYIDPLFHTFVTGKSGRNIDSWLLNDDFVRYLFCKNFNNADIAVVEGVMGMYDGFGTTSSGSTAHVSKILKLPLIMVMNVKGMSLSSAAIVKGFCDFDKDVNIKGLILNKIKSTAQYELIKKIIEQNTSVKVLGFLPDDEKIAMESRHLGLVAAEEMADIQKKLLKLRESVLEFIDIDGIIEIAKETKEIDVESIAKPSLKGLFDGIKIGVAYDKAFNFYYTDNMELLESTGAEIVCFSPIKDTSLPDGISGLYFGGGYPEIFAKELEKNEGVRKEIKDVIEKGMPVYAECGGLMYMTEGITDKYDSEYSMVGALKGKCKMGNALRNFGYVECEMHKECILGEVGTKFKAHEFHYSVEKIEDADTCLHVVKKRDGKETVWESGYVYKNLMASYPHIHFWSNMELALNFLEKCKNYK